MIDRSLLECNERGRRSELLAGSGLNGIDYVAVVSPSHRTLRVHWLKPLAALPTPAQVVVRGGIRVAGITVSQVDWAPGNPAQLEVTVDRLGDHSAYVLDFTTADAFVKAAAVDPVLGRIVFSFMQGCPVDADCPHQPPCPLRAGTEPSLDYLAKDYASFRQLMLDLVPLRNPAFTERNIADIGIAMIETLAYAGDRLSYFQDAIAGEAYLETARQRISVRRHARLVDYPMHDGRNAWTYVHVAVNVAGHLPQGTGFLSRVAAPLAGTTTLPGLSISSDAVTPDTLTGDAALNGAVVFESAHPIRVDPTNNQILIHTFGDEECYLAPGTMEAYLFVDQSHQATRPSLKPGDYLLLEEVLGPSPWPRPEEANKAHRQVVRLIGTEPTTDPLYGASLLGGIPQRSTGADDALPLLHVTWRLDDALTFPLCLSVRRGDGNLQAGVSVARGNMVLADHGLTVQEDLTVADAGSQTQLPHGPVTTQCRPAVRFDRLEYRDGRVSTPRFSLEAPAEEAQPAVLLFPLGARDPWIPRPDLLESSPFDTHFVVEVDDQGQASLRFGDGEYGRRVDPGQTFSAVYRVGNGRNGNVGRDTLAHVLVPRTGLPVDVLAVRNPLPARDGTDPEAIEEVRQKAPRAFAARQFRGVTEDDYALAARSLPGVADAVASFRWTGSWRSVLVAIKPQDPGDLWTSPDGRIRLRDRFLESARDGLEAQRIAGYDLDIRAAQFVPLRVALQVSAAPGYFRQDIRDAVADALSTRDLPDGRRGFFHLANFSFGDPVYLSQVIAVAAQLDGVGSVMATEFRRLYDPTSDSLRTGIIPMAAWEIARLDNDPDFPDHGTLAITAVGGKA